MSRWSKSEKDLEIAHVESNRNIILFCAGFGCYLLNDKKYLIKFYENVLEENLYLEFLFWKEDTNLGGSFLLYCLYHLLHKCKVGRTWMLWLPMPTIIFIIM